MPRSFSQMKRLGLWLGTLAFTGFLAGCTQTIPKELIEAVESIDQNLTQLRAAEFAPKEYASFATRLMTLRVRAEVEEDIIHWPWESNELELALRQLKEEGTLTLERLTERQERLRRAAEQRLTFVEERAMLINGQVDAIEGRLVLEGKPVEADLLIKQARAFYDQGYYEQSLDASDRAILNLEAQAVALNRELGRYASRDRINHWRHMAKQTIDWSKQHHASAIVVSKAERTITLYSDGKKVLSYPVKLGFNGIREKRFQGDGATPEGRYHVSEKRGQGQTQFYRALALNYPNQEDQKRFSRERRAGHIPTRRSIGGQIEIHGVESELMAQTLGCIMLENPHMAALFNRVRKGTPVTIVGTLNEQNAVALALAKLATLQDES
ncbi:L,D-transpeptidase family protein [Petrachloros mirabilis]